jgi:hypothetical protein
MENEPISKPNQIKNIYDDFEKFLLTRKTDPTIQNMTIREVIELFYNQNV